MAQARRKSAKARRGGGGGLSGVGMLLAGMVIGALATYLWLGANAGDGSGVGAGLRQFISDRGGRDSPPSEQPAVTDSQSDKPATDFTFFTVLPEIEVVAPAPTASTAPPAEAKPPVSDATAAAQPKSAAAKPAAGDSQFMLQAGSYRNHPDADRLKAKLALSGLASSIQKVTIQGRGDFYRVRLGPFPTYAAMMRVNEQLGRAGIKALPLKMKAG